MRIAFRLMLACLFGVMASAASAQTVTAKYTLNNSTWTDLGPGPLMLSFNGSGGVYAISDATPTLVREGFGRSRGGSVPVRTSSHVWAMAQDNFGVTAYVAPISP